MTDAVSDKEKVTRLHEQINSGLDDARLLQRIDSVFSEIEEKCIATFRKSDMHDVVGWRTCKNYMRVLDDVRKRCEHNIRRGDTAQKELIRLKDPSILKRIMPNA